MPQLDGVHRGFLAVRFEEMWSSRVQTPVELPPYVAPRFTQLAIDL